MVEEIIIERIKKYNNAIMDALDAGDWILAMKKRAAQKELIDILNRNPQSNDSLDLETKTNYVIVGAMDNAISEGLNLDNYYTTRQVMSLLGRARSSVTRKKKDWQAIKRGDGLLFPKLIIDKVSGELKGKAKPGRKSKKI